MFLLALLYRSEYEAKDCPVCTIQIYRGFSVITWGDQQQKFNNAWQASVVTNKLTS